MMTYVQYVAMCTIYYTDLHERNRLTIDWKETTARSMKENLKSCHI